MSEPKSRALLAKELELHCLGRSNPVVLDWLYANWRDLKARLEAAPPEELAMQQSALSAGASVIQQAINADPKEWGGAVAVAEAVYKAMRADLIRYLPSPQKE